MATGSASKRNYMLHQEAESERLFATQLPWSCVCYKRIIFEIAKKKLFIYILYENDHMYQEYGILVVRRCITC